MRFLSVIEEPPVIERILCHLAFLSSLLFFSFFPVVPSTRPTPAARVLAMYIRRTSIKSRHRGALYTCRLVESVRSAQGTSAHPVVWRHFGSPAAVARCSAFGSRQWPAVVAAVWSPGGPPRLARAVRARPVAARTEPRAPVSARGVPRWAVRPRSVSLGTWPWRCARRVGQHSALALPDLSVPRPSARYWRMVSPAASYTPTRGCSSTVRLAS